MVLFLIRYGEMALKSPNVRRHWQRILVGNIEDAFIKAHVPCRVETTWGRLWVITDDAQIAASVLGRTFGVVSFSQAVETTSEMSELRRMGAELALSKDAQTFKVVARRTGTHPYTSMDINSQVGEAVLDAFAAAKRTIAVDLHGPELELGIEVRDSHAYLFTTSVQGPGGLPLGTQGTLLMMLFSHDLMGRLTIEEDGPTPAARSFLAAYLMMKRGCGMRLVVPEGEGSEVIEAISMFDPKLRSYPAHPEGPDQDKGHREYIKGVKGIVIPRTLSELEGRMELLDPVEGLPVYAPLSGLNGARLEEWVRDALARM